MAAPVPPGAAAPRQNRLGLAIADYKGGKTTLCAGCGHNAISERLLEAMFDLGVPPERVAKFSGIGCSSKTPAYFMSRSHAFNAVHGRMPAVATGALLANRTLVGVGVSGDGDTASIGIGQFAHLMRRNLPILYVVEDNGVYGLTKGQFSATADVGSRLKSGVANELPPIDTCALAVQLGATFVGRSFSGDKRQLSAMLKAALSHRGTAMLDVLSPCVTFNDHEGSTRSFAYVKEHDAPLQELSYVPAFEDVTVDYDPGTTVDVELHDGAHLRLRKLEEGFDPRDRTRAVARLMEASARGEVLTGVFFVDAKAASLTDQLRMVEAPLATLPEARVRPPPAVLEEIMASLR
ncbi:thiamine pyrophosphate protein domain protein TPP-binding [Anaeromyxobacter dehalogenans 2CP-1]|uniref:Thiamine pyrophosphate protein domain protein TPP-binding n=1 Tax=Anaeromyxobacter dehalogenans (strain ATCC BAA-258 / DSM 21875 / 2CP-1) TaxID=455488 RepID=B8JGR0_ANAD2|nr:2-oxoacid:ferredoxin oxidoreductase subunit beta [Anaeromyxobacter dehalogenans]ACL66547.1 thiamine pyrophosphate protein domain protein TPP-binding [Anaeromyxobacter dehalogenans 2CP-1]